MSITHVWNVPGDSREKHMLVPNESHLIRPDHVIARSGDVESRDLAQL